MASSRSGRRTSHSPTNSFPSVSSSSATWRRCKTRTKSCFAHSAFLPSSLEGEEARKKAAQSTANAQEAEEMRQQVARYRDELQSTSTQIDSYMKERDMFRRMLQHRGQLPPDTDLQSMFGQSIGPATPQRNGASPVPPTPRSKDVEDLNKLLREQQAFFDQYRNETSTDRKIAQGAS